MKKEKMRVLMVGVIVVLAVVTRLPLFTMPFLDVDEALFAIFARVWQHGGIPYVNAVETKAMGIYYFYVMASWLAGSLPDINMMAVHALSVAWTLLTAGVAGRLAMRLLPGPNSERAGWWAAFMFVCFTAFYFPKIIATNIEVVLLLPVCLAMLLVLRPQVQLQRWQCCGAGILVAASMLCKYQAGIIIPVLVLYFWLNRGPGYDWQLALRNTVYFALGGLPLPILMLWHLDHTGALADYFFWNFLGSLQYIKTGSSTVLLGQKLVTHVLSYILCTLLVWWLLVARLVQLPWLALRSYGREHPQEIGVWLWFGFCIIPVSMGYRFYGHYFLLLMPQLCILAAVQLASWSPTVWWRRRPWIVTGILVPMIVATTFCYTMPRFYPLVHEEYIPDYAPYGAYLKARTLPTDRILVWGYSPAVYWYAERLPATRFLWSDVLVGRVPGLQESVQRKINSRAFENPYYWLLFYQDLEQHPPAYIIDMAPTGLHNYQKFPMANYPILMRYVQDHYSEEMPFQGARVFRLK